MSDPSIVKTIDSAGPFQWVPFIDLLELSRSVEEIIGRAEVEVAYMRAVSELVSSPVLAPLVHPLFRVLGERSFVTAFPAGWSMLTRGAGRVECFRDEEGSWARFKDVPERLFEHPLFAPGLLWTIRSVVAPIDAQTRVWEVDDAGDLAFGVCSPKVRGSG